MPRQSNLTRLLQPTLKPLRVGGASGGTPVEGDWLLATGFWNDSGVWDDTANWID